jgi:hypothetical protein
MTNRASRHLSALARCAAVLREYEAGERTQAEIAKRRGVTRQRISAMIGYANLQRDLAFAKRDTDALTAMARSEQTDAEDAAWDRFAQGCPACGGEFCRCVMNTQPEG